MMNKKLMIGIVICVCFIWSCKIYGINQVKEIEYSIEMKENYQDMSLNIAPVEANLFTRKEFMDYFRLDDEILEFINQDCKYICVCLNVTNVTNKDLSWDYVMELTNCGFETRTWCSATMPDIGSRINIFHDDCLRRGTSQEIWYVTSVDPVCFKMKTWKKLRCQDFVYVLKLKPEKVIVLLE